MNWIKILKVAFFLVLSCISVWWTATSLHASMGETPLYVWCAIALIFQLIAGYVGLGGVKRQWKSVTPSISAICGWLMVWLFFWFISFTTNVHHNVIVQHGFNNVNAQLQDCRKWVEGQRSQSVSNDARTIKSEQDGISGKVHGLQDQFVRNLNNTVSDEIGFGKTCVDLLKRIEAELAQSALKVDDKRQYKQAIFDDINDRGDYGRGRTSSNERKELVRKYNDRIDKYLTMHLCAIASYYEGIQTQTAQYDTLKQEIVRVEKSREFRIAKEDNSAEAISNCYKLLNNNVIAKMPDEYKKHLGELEKDHDGNLRYKTYPSDRMFDVMSVWSDWRNNKLPDYISLSRHSLISLLIDAAAWLLV